MRARKRTWVPVSVRLPSAIHKRIGTILQAKPHYTQQAIIVDLIEQALPAYERERSASN